MNTLENTHKLAKLMKRYIHENLTIILSMSIKNLKNNNEYIKDIDDFNNHLLVMSLRVTLIVSNFNHHKYHKKTYLIFNSKIDKMLACGKDYDCLINILARLTLNELKNIYNHFDDLYPKRDLSEKRLQEDIYEFLEPLLMTLETRLLPASKPCCGCAEKKPYDPNEVVFSLNV